jgi:hypothetical protein
VVQTRRLRLATLLTNHPFLEVDMSRTRWTFTLLVAVIAIGGLAVVMLSGDSTALMLTGGVLLLLAAGGGLILALSALWRNYTEPTTLFRAGGPILLTVEQKRTRLRQDALRGLLGALILPIIVVIIDDNPKQPLAARIVAGVVVGAVTGPLLFRWLPPWRSS